MYIYVYIYTFVLTFTLRRISDVFQSSHPVHSHFHEGASTKAHT